VLARPWWSSLGTRGRIAYVAGQTTFVFAVLQWYGPWARRRLEELERESAARGAA
jgi:hypothetical protein